MVKADDRNDRELVTLSILLHVHDVERDQAREKNAARVVGRRRNITSSIPVGDEPATGTMSRRKR